VEKGGATVFPYINVALFPKKGAAAFWYNLSTSGDLGESFEAFFDKQLSLRTSSEYLTRHSGCPVLVGSKWVANKWQVTDIDSSDFILTLSI
jgi:prolyl 4-hydroxylase